MSLHHIHRPSDLWDHEGLSLQEECRTLVLLVQQWFVPKEWESRYRKRVKAKWNDRWLHPWIVYSTFPHPPKLPALRSCLRASTGALLPIPLPLSLLLFLPPLSLLGMQSKTLGCCVTPSPLTVTQCKMRTTQERKRRLFASESDSRSWGSGSHGSHSQEEGRWELVLSSPSRSVWDSARRSMSSTCKSATPYWQHRSLPPRWF